MKKFKSVLLVDDSQDDNFIHQRVLVKSELVANENIFIKENGEEAYDFLVDVQNTEKYKGIFPPQLILLDISMPCMDGFEFLEEYQKVKEQFDLMVIVMLTTSINSQDKERAKKFPQVVGYVEKPLTKEKIYDIHEQYFGKQENFMTSMEELKQKIEVLEKQLAEKDKKLREKDMIFEFILESSLAGYWDWYIQDDYEYMSPSFKKMFGYEDHEIENNPQSWQAIIHPEDLQGVFEVFNAHVESKGEKPYYNTVRYFHKNGSIVWVHCCGQVIEWGDDGKPLRMIGSHIDITLLKNAEKKLQARNKELSELNNSLKEFTHVVSHDLQEPLRGIKNNCVFLLEDHEFTPEITATIERVIHLAKYSKNLLDDLLMYSSLGIEATISEVDVSQLLLTLKKAFVYSAGNVEIEIEGDFPTIFSDESLLTQVFRNLIANGIKYNHSEVKRIKVGFLADQNTFYVADNGIGIKERHYAKVFRIFCRLNKKSDFPEGTGVGLNLVKKIVEKHDGRIWVESEYEKGTKFFFTLNNLECDDEEKTQYSYYRRQ